MYAGAQKWGEDATLDKLLKVAVAHAIVAVIEMQFSALNPPLKTGVPSRNMRVITFSWRSLKRPRNRS